MRPRPFLIYGTPGLRELCYALFEREIRSRRAGRQPSNRLAGILRYKSQDKSAGGTPALRRQGSTFSLLETYVAEMGRRGAAGIRIK
jgi:hypothetical protein